jgi:hypothetical protein
MLPSYRKWLVSAHLFMILSEAVNQVENLQEHIATPNEKYKNLIRNFARLEKQRVRLRC